MKDSVAAVSQSSQPAHHSANGNHADTNSAASEYSQNGIAPNPETSDPEVQVLATAKHHRQTMSAIAASDTANDDFSDPAAACCMGAIRAAVKSFGAEADSADVMDTLNQWAKDTANSDRAYHATQAAQDWKSLPKPDTTPDAATKYVLKRAREIHERGVSTRAATLKTEQPKTQAERLHFIAQCEAKFFRDDTGQAFATVQRSGAAFTYSLTSTTFRDWLSLRYQEETGQVATNSGAMQAVISTLRGATANQEPQAVFVRVAASETAVYYDLGDAQGRAVEITADGWRILASAPVPFVRPKGLLPQAEPQRGGNLQALRELVNIGDDDDFILYASWLIAFFRPFGPPPHLGLIGEQGTGKTSTTSNSRRLLDPNAASTRKEPKEPRDLAIAGKNNAVIAFDNLSHLPQWLSDFLCCLSTGAGFAARELYANDEEAIFAMKRPVIFNAINEVATRPDLLDRSIILELPLLSTAARRAERAQESAFQQHAPAILGALFDAVSCGLKNLPSTRIEHLPRMADFAMWAAACSPAFGWTADQFLAAYTGNRETAQSVATDLSPLAATIEEWASGRTGVIFTGTPQELFEEIGRCATPEIKSTRSWPKDAAATGRELTRLAPVLRAHGINATQRRANGKRSWEISAGRDNFTGTDTGTTGTIRHCSGTDFQPILNSNAQNSAGSAGKSPSFSVLGGVKREEEEREKERRRKGAGFTDPADPTGTGHAVSEPYRAETADENFFD